jgi:ligand-binding sensor domain-containing protein
MFGHTTGDLKGIENMVLDHAGNVWLGGRKTMGVCRYDGKELINLKPNSSDWLMPELVDKNGNVYFWGSDLPFKYDGKSFTSFPREAFADWVYEVSEDNDGNTWFGYLGVGVYQYDGKNFTYFGAKDGFDQKGVTCIFTDKDGYTWFGTKNIGLIRYNGKTFTSFSE